MNVKFNVKTDALNDVDKTISSLSTKGETWLANEILKDTNPYVPFRTGSFAGRARVDGNMVIYPGPYARYLYYGKVMVDAATGKGPMHFIDKNGNEVIRFRKGAVLKATDKDLVFTTDHHAQAQAYWFEASKAQNLPKWLRGVKKIV